MEFSSQLTVVFQSRRLALYKKNFLLSKAIVAPPIYVVHDDLECSYDDLKNLIVEHAFYEHILVIPSIL